MTSSLFPDATGSSPAERAGEAIRILEMIGLSDLATDKLSERDRAFLKDIRQRIARWHGKTIITPRQLFWLRDIKDRCLEL